MSIVQQLRRKLEEYNRRCARRAGWNRRFIPTDLPPLDGVLPHGGLPCGAVTEILSSGHGVGAMSLAMRIAARCKHARLHERAQSCTATIDPQAHGVSPVACAPGSDQRWIVLIDTEGDFYPPAASYYGIALDRLIVIRPRCEKDALWAVDQSLRCPAVAAAVAPLKRLDDRFSRRLQLAAESSGCLGLVLRSADRRTKSFAAVQMLVEGAGSGSLDQEGEIATSSPRTHAAPPLVGDAYPCRVTLLKVREGMPVGPLMVDLHHETGTCPLYPVPVERPVAKFA